MIMRKRNIIVAAVLLLAAPAFAAGTYMDEVEVRADLAQKREALPTGNLFSILDDKSLTAEESDALAFLYAYMPVGDITDYSGDFYLENVRSSLATRGETVWGRTIPDDIFRHFVLPVRVNNENLDRSRMVFHDELMPRLKGLSMYDAVLEVNHWCHEKANYQPSDARTSSPLATVSTAYGRCGEESTFLVAALRSVGIPARQVYTPRWAHTDDNHAWVEAWVDGRWYFLGACEPEPVLNLGWFNAPASRGMLMHTKVFGRYEGPEEVMRTTANYTEINVIDNYAQNARATVSVVDGRGNPVEGARVEFKLYNYAEFYTVSAQTTGKDGKASLSAGLGDMVVLAVKDGRFGLKKVSFGKDKEIVLNLEHRIGEELSFPIDIVPPSERANLPEVTAEQRAENDRRFNLEDSIRNAYIATFPNNSVIAEFAGANGYEYADVENYVKASRGNYRQIMSINERIENEFPGTGNADAAHILGSIVRFPDIMDQSRKADVVNDENWDQVRGCIEAALDRICEYREAEGKSLYADVTAKVRNILDFIPEIEALEGERTAAIKERIISKMAEIEAQTDHDRLEQEMIYYIEKLDINEEKVRLRQHCRYFMETIENDPYPGKKLGFIAQEMGREINTTGSKANHSGIQKIVVRMKDELEKIKEQSLNIL